MEMKNIIITGSTGMVGNLALSNCLSREDANKVTIITRRKTGIVHPKLTEVVHDNFMDFLTYVDMSQNTLFHN
jgi:NAD dependent epimerase/dehydratase family enzyme